MEVRLKDPAEPGNRLSGILAVWLAGKDEPSVWSVDEVVAAPEGAEKPSPPGVPPAVKE